ncbi:hypothetical protein, partial [Streptomyces sp. A475]|uniref:hypothetical protein n=1 Tax=Streptomyces sp. A475 TaxID=3131976 RepID=UPI0030EC9AB2
MPGHVRPLATAERGPLPRAAGAVGEVGVVLSAKAPWTRTPRSPESPSPCDRHRGGLRGAAAQVVAVRP